MTDRTMTSTSSSEGSAAAALKQPGNTGRNLKPELVAEKKSGIITTLIHKFDKAYAVKKYQDESPSDMLSFWWMKANCTQFGSFSARMRWWMFPMPNTGFTGTPLLKKRKRTTSSNSVNWWSLIIPSHRPLKMARWFRL
ncbi:MAG: hypothetical protein R3E74_11090 [Pseudomonadales bacterium]